MLICLHRLQTKHKISRLQIEQLEKRFAESIEKGGIQLNTEPNEDMKQIVTDSTKHIRSLSHSIVFFGTKS